MKKSKFTRDIEKLLIRSAPKVKSSALPDDYLMGNGSEISKLKFLNHSMPFLRRELAARFPVKSDGDHLFQPMQSLWFESDIFDAKSLALYWLDRQSGDFFHRHRRELLRWVDGVDNWAHSDALCSVYARLFESSQKLVLPVYRKWNSHRNSWHRRCSMVGTFYYSRSRKNQPSFALARGLVTPHLGAPEYYVQKGVGWTIREMYNVYPDETIEYIKNNISKISAVAWVAASEKLPAGIKAPLLEKRRLLRKKN